MRLIATLLFLTALLALCGQKSDSGITHSIVVSGPMTMEIGEDDAVVWHYNNGSKDASKLANGNYLITYGKKVVEVSPEKAVVWTYNKTINDELMSAQRLSDGKTLVTELGKQPRLVEVDAAGKVAAAIPLQPETTNSHRQTRMARKLPNGNYLAPHRVMPFVKEYDAAGKVLHIFRLDIPEMGGPSAANGSFCASRLKDGSTVITCASGNRMVMFDKDHKLVWQLTTKEIGGVLQDVCGLQVLKSGNFLVSCYGNKAADGLKMLEITRDKKIVWTYQNAKLRYVHNVHVLTTNGKPE